MPRRRSENERALGPYKHGAKWRVIYVGANGVREMESYPTKAEAIAQRDAANLTAGNRSVSDAVDEYLEQHRNARGYETMRYRLRSILRFKDDCGQRPLIVLTRAEAQRLYDQRSMECSLTTSDGELRYVSNFCAWCMKRGWLALNPFDAIERKEGERKRGKPKLRVNPTRKFLAYLSNDESIEATAVMMALVLGLRASAVVKRTVEDLDDNGWLLWVRNNKTAAGDLEIEIPPMLRDRLLKIAKDKRPTDLLFTKANGAPANRRWLLHHTERLCKKAGVPRVTPHGLRGSGATMAVRLGGSVENVARALGHADDGDTLKAHYLGGGAIESARARGIESLILGMKPDRIVPSDDPEAN